MPNENTTWTSVLERGVDKDYGHLAIVPKARRRLQVVTESQQYGSAVYTPHSIVVPQFAVNLSVELPRLPNQGLAKPLVNYFGTLVIQYVENMYMNQKARNDVMEEIKDHSYD